MAYSVEHPGAGVSGLLRRVGGRTTDQPLADRLAQGRVWTVPEGPGDGSRPGRPCRRTLWRRHGGRKRLGRQGRAGSAEAGRQRDRRGDDDGLDAGRPDRGRADQLFRDHVARLLRCRQRPGDHNERRVEYDPRRSGPAVDPRIDRHGFERGFARDGRQRAHGPCRGIPQGRGSGARAFWEAAVPAPLRAGDRHRRKRHAGYGEIGESLPVARRRSQAAAGDARGLPESGRDVSRSRRDLPPAGSGQNASGHRRAGNGLHLQRPLGEKARGRRPGGRREDDAGRPRGLRCDLGRASDRRHGRLPALYERSAELGRSVDNRSAESR